MQKLFWLVNKILYPILGPNNSTKLSQSALGTFLLKLTTGYDAHSLKVYQGNDGIKLRLTGQEAKYFGFLHFGTMNLYETKVMKTVLSRGDTFIDIGAYVDGWHAIVASHAVGESGSVYTFEPIPQFYERLLENLRLNNTTNVIAERKAVASKNGKSTFYMNNASSSFFQDHAKHGKLSRVASIRVTIITLDSYISKHRIKNIRLVKLDAEGAEMEVLKGSTKILSAKNPPDMIIEIDDRYLKSGGSSENEVIKFLKKYGYKPYCITEKGLSSYMSKEDGRELFNVFFSTRQVL